MCSIPRALLDVLKVTHTTFALGIARAMDMVFWMFSYKELVNHSGLHISKSVGIFVLLAQFVHMAIMGDFFYYYGIRCDGREACSLRVSGGYGGIGRSGGSPLRDRGAVVTTSCIESIGFGIDALVEVNPVGVLLFTVEPGLDKVFSRSAGAVEYILNHSCLIALRRGTPPVVLSVSFSRSICLDFDSFQGGPRLFRWLRPRYPLPAECFDCSLR